MEGGLVRLRVLFLYRVSGELVLISPLKSLISLKRTASGAIPYIRCYRPGSCHRGFGIFELFTSE